jgi:hypothetical protein
MAACGFMPSRSSSRILSLINTLESMAMPRVSAIAAMPGRVRVACRKERAATKSRMLAASAMTEKKPIRR